MEELLAAQTAEQAQPTVELPSLDFGNIALSDLFDYVTSLGKNIISAILIYIIGRFIIKYIIKLVRKVMRKRKVDASLFSFFSSLVSITLNFIMVVAIIGVLGVETSSFVALFASAGIAIGMALSGTLQNFAGGVMILFFHPYKVGDYIEAQGYAGTVKEILIFNTVLVTPDNQTVIIPNGPLATGSLRNYSKEMTRRIDIDVEVAYGTDPDDVRRVVSEIASTDQRVLTDTSHEMTIPMTQMSSSSIVFQVRVWTSAANYWNVKFDMTEQIYKQFRQEGIEIPFQQLDVHLKQS